MTKRALETLGLCVTAAITAIGVTKYIGKITRKKQDTDELEYLELEES